MINNNYLRLISKLIDATKENRVSWRESTRDNEFVAEISDYSVAVLYNPKSLFTIDLDRTAICVISILNEEGVMIDSCSFTSGEEGYDSAVALYNEAKRSFYRVDDVLKELTDSL